MQVYGVGEKIREERKRKQISGEELCIGICSVATLSRIENNTQKPTLKVEEALLQRLGCDTDGLIYYADKQALIGHGIENELTVLTMHRRPVEEKLAEYRKYIKNRSADTNLEEQFAMMIEAIHAFYTNGWELQIIYGQLEEALRITIPNFKEENLEEVKLLTQTEITIINNLALIRYRQEKVTKAIRMMYYLINYVEKGNIGIENANKKYPMLLCNLAKVLEETGSYGEMLELCEKGIVFCKKYSRLIGLSEFCYYKALACTKYNRNVEAIENYEYAISLCKLTDRPKEVEQLQKAYGELIKNSCSKNQNQ